MVMGNGLGTQCPADAMVPICLERDGTAGSEGMELTAASTCSGVMRFMSGCRVGQPSGCHCLLCWRERDHCPA